MKTRILITATLIVLTQLVYATKSETEGINFFHSWEDALKAAKKADKPIFIDFYTTWCGPCKWMAKNTFTDQEVVNFYNQNFISLKIDCDKEGEELQEMAGLTAYPTLGFFTSEGDFFTKEVGALDADQFLKLGRKVVNGIGDKSPLSGLEDPNFEIKFSQLLNDDPEQAKKMADEWLNQVAYEDISNPNIWFLINEYKYDPNEPLVLEIIDNLAEVKKQYNIDDYLDKLIATLFEKEIARNKKDPSEFFKNTYYRIIKGLNNAEQPEEYYHLFSATYFYQATENYSDMMNNLKQISEKYDFDKWSSLIQNINLVMEYHNNNEHLSWANSWADRAIELEENGYTLFAKAKILGLTGNNEKAVAYAEKAMDVTDDYYLFSEIDEWLSYTR